MDFLQYDEMVEQALRGVVRDALKQAQEHGLEGNHHFYLGFATNRSDIVMPEHIRERHPEEITVVLQHQFWDLEVDNRGFSVTLSFDGNQEKLYVPFVALTSFMDPSVRFALQFTPIPEEASPESPTPTDDSPEGKVVTLDAFRKK